MPAVLDPKPAPAASKYDDAVRTTLDDTGRKIRANDALTGGLIVAAVALAYAVAVVLLDRWLDLPAWSRQLGLVGLLAVLGAAGWYLVARPYRRTVNPRYVARQVEGTISDAKNAVINWVDLQDRDIPGSVRTAMSQKAAAGLAESDPADAVASTRMAWAGGVVAVLVGVLAVLFLIFKSQFLSLLGRAFNPFTDKAIVTRTSIELVAPTGDLTVTDGQQIGFAVNVTGNIPTVGSPQQVRLKVRYTPDAAEFDEYPFDKGDTIREYSFTAKREHIQNGFWYRVAAGDAETPEYRVTVRARPMIQTFEAKYEYPEYLRLKPDTGREPRIDGFRGTNVAFTVKTNRTVKAGTLTTDIAGQETPVVGEVVGDGKDSLRFKLTLQDKGTYTIRFASTEGEDSGATVPYPIEVYVDQPPTVAILKPETEEVVLPTTGRLDVDALVGDDHGIASATLKFKVAGGPAIAPKPFREGKTFQRDTDKSYPTSLDYKDSVKLDALKGTDGKPVVLQPDTVLEYWVEATDNCTVPAANVGKSKVQRVRLTKPEMEPMKQQEQQKQQEKRQADEKQNNQQQDEKNKGEKRDPQQPQNREKNPNQPEKGDPMNGGMGENDPNQKPPEGQEPKTKPDPTAKPPEQPNPADDAARKKAEELQNKIDEQQNQPGQAKGDPNPQKNMPEEQSAQGKPGDKGQPPPDAGQNKPEPMDPKSGDGEGKGAGDVQQPNKTEAKPEPKPGEDPNAGDPNAAPKQGPKPNDQDGAGQDKSSKPLPGQAEKPPLKPGEKPRDTDGAGGKGAGEEPKDPMDPKPEPKAGEKDGPKNAGQGKPSGDVNRGEQKKPEPGQQGDATEQPKPGAEQPKPDPDQKPGDGRGKEPVKEGAGKPDPNKGAPMGTKPEPAEGKEPPKGTDPMKPEEQAGEGKGEGAKPDPMTDPNAQPTEKGEQKPTQQGNGGKPDAAKQKEFEDAANDLGSDDPAKREAAKKKLEDLAKQAGKGEQGGTEKPRDLTKDEKEKLGEAAKDLNNPDADKRKAAEKKADDLIGKGQREKLQQQAKDFEKNVEDLGSDDKATRDAAKEKLDKTVGEDVRKKAEQVAADKKSMDEKQRADAKKQEEELAKQQAGQKANDPNAKPRELTEKEKQELADAAKDLAGMDEGKRKAAEEKLDQQIGKEARENLQQDLKGNDPKKAEAAKEKLEQMAKQAKEQQDQQWKTGGVPPKGPDGKPLEDNPANRLKAAELQLKNFKEFKDNPEFLKKADMSAKEMADFIKGYEAAVARQRTEVEQAKAAEARQPGPDPKRNVSDGSGANTRLTGPDTQPGGPSAGGAATAPPGYDKAHLRFAEELNKQLPKK